MSKEKYLRNSGMNLISLSAISLSGYCGFLLEARTEGVEENARTWAAVAAVLPPHPLHLLRIHTE